MEKKEGSKKLKAASFSIVANAFLIILKAAVAIFTGSIALLAEFAHSIFDMVASLLAYAGIRKAEEPADIHHHYGHEKFENLSSLAQTILIVITSAFIIYEALLRIAEPKKVEAGELGIIVMLVTIGVDYFISRFLHKSSKEYESSALEADAYHFTTDLWGAISVVVGLGFVLAGFPVFDSVAAIIVALLMLWISYKLGRKAINVLMDKSPDESVIKGMEEVLSNMAGVEKFHKLKARQAGNKMHVDVHIHVKPDMTVAEGHKLAHEVKKKLMEKFPPIKDVTVHVEPA